MVELDFSLQEYENRIKQVQKKIAESRLDALIVMGAENIHYICGYDGAFTVPFGEFSCLVVPASGEPRMMVRASESKTVKRQATQKPRIYTDFGGPWQVLREILEESKSVRGTIGVEENSITLRRFNRFKENFPEAKIVAVSGLVESVMAVPSPLEAEFTRKAGKITQAGIQKAVETMKEGVPYYEVVTQANQALYRAGMTDDMVLGMYILNCVWGGPDGGAMHETDVTRKIQKGDLVTAEIWGNYKHYAGAAQSTVYIGKKPPANVVDTYKVIADMYLGVREALKPGAVVGEVWEAGNKPYRAAYGSDYYRMIGMKVGSGVIGRLDRGVQEILQPGVAFMVQPQTNDPLLITVAGMLMVTEKGCEELTRPLLELKTV